MNTDNLKDAAKSAFRVWVFTTIGLFLPGMLGWIREVTLWAAEKGAPAFPDPSNLVYLFVAAVTAAFPAAVAGIFRLVENASGQSLAGPRASGPALAPAPNPGDRGAIDTRLIAVIALAAVVIVILFLVF